jgi:hypothetical protein
MSGAVTQARDFEFIGMESGFPQKAKPWWQPCDHEVVILGVTIFEDKKEGAIIRVPYVDGTDSIQGGIYKDPQCTLSGRPEKAFPPPELVGRLRDRL